jgi:hypothetical protein
MMQQETLMSATQRMAFATMLRNGMIAGAAGGLAEVAWVSLYATLTGANAASVAHGVTTAVGATALLSDNAVMLGIGIHMTIALALGISLAAAWQAVSNVSATCRPPYGFVLAVLVGVWAMNFFVVLPVVSPDFIHLVPYAVSFVSKLLFGIAAAEVLRRTATQTGRAAYARVRA